jgi:hypothetical protein
MSALQASIGFYFAQRIGLTTYPMKYVDPSGLKQFKHQSKFTKKYEHKYYYTTSEGQRPGITNIGRKPYEKRRRPYDRE